MKIWEERETDRPAIGNRSMVVSDPLIREKIKTIVDNLLQ
jgi:hypothetical protein